MIERFPGFFPLRMNSNNVSKSALVKSGGEGGSVINLKDAAAFKCLKA